MDYKEEKRRVWIYTRLRSTEAQLAAQKAQLLQKAMEQGYTVVGSSMDDADGFLFQRAGLKAALHSVRTGEADAILVMRLGNVSHDTAVLYRVLKTLQNHGAKLLVSGGQLRYTLHSTGLEHRLRERARRKKLGLPW